MNVTGKTELEACMLLADPVIKYVRSGRKTRSVTRLRVKAWTWCQCSSVGTACTDTHTHRNMMGSLATEDICGFGITRPCFTVTVCLRK